MYAVVLVTGLNTDAVVRCICRPATYIYTHSFIKIAHRTLYINLYAVFGKTYFNIRGANNAEGAGYGKGCSTPHQEKGQGRGCAPSPDNLFDF